MCKQAAYKIIKLHFKEGISFILIQTINILTAVISKSVSFLTGIFRIEIHGDYPQKNNRFHDKE